VQVDDRVTSKVSRLNAGRAATQSRQALYWYAASVGRLRGDGDDDRHPGVELVAPPDGHGLPALGLDRRTGHGPVIAPYR
jgi:hypothetical protein